MELKIGKTYKLTSANNKYATYLAQITPDRALFVSQDFGPTPFISWQYKIVDEDRIECCYGTYYFELKYALEEKRNRTLSTSQHAVDILRTKESNYETK